jgi:hypothetical protein
MQNPFTRLKIRYIILDFILIIFFTAFVMAIAGPRDIKTLDPVFGLSLYCWVMILIGFAINRRLNKLQIKTYQLVGKTSLKALPWLLLLIIFYADRHLGNGINRLAAFFTHLASPALLKTEIEKIDIGIDSNSLQFPNLAVFILATVIVAPITEEFIFRGVLLHRWSAKWGKTSAILISSIIFGLVHGDIFFMSRIVSGMIYSLIYLETKTLVVPVILHAMHNALALASTIVAHLSSANQDVEVSFRDLWYGLINTALALPVLFYFIKWPRDSEPLPYTANKESEETS